MENDRLNPTESDEDYIKPQMNYCCGSKTIDLSPKFKDARTRCVFVALAFVIKLVELTFVAFVLYDLSADGVDEIKFNITFVTLAELKVHNWVMFLAGAIVVIIYSIARCGGGGRGFCMGLLLNLLNTFSVAVFFAALITTDLMYPYRYIVFLAVTSICLICLGICVLTTLFEMNVLGRTMYTALFIYFLVMFLFAHFAYVSTLRQKYKLGYVFFLAHVGIGGGVGLFLGMVMFWYIQDLICGKVVSLKESEYLYVNLLI